MAKRKKYKVVTADVFGSKIAVFRSFKDLARAFPSAPEFERPSDAGCAAWEDGGVVWFALILPDGVSIPTAAHECVHAADFIMEHTGVPAQGNTEVRAYLTAHILQQVLDALPR